MVTLPKANEDHNCEWTVASLDALIQQLIVVHSGVATVGRIEQSLNPYKTLVGEDETAEIWAARERESTVPEAFAKSHVDQWRELGCAADGAPYVLHGLIDQLTSPFIPAIRHESDEAKALASAFLDEAHCPGAHGLSKADKAKLKVIAASAVPQAPKPEIPRDQIALLPLRWRAFTNPSRSRKGKDKNKNKDRSSRNRGNHSHHRNSHGHNSHDRSHGHNSPGRSHDGNSHDGSSGHRLPGLTPLFPPRPYSTEPA